MIGLAAEDAALLLLQVLVDRFPGLVDGESDVNGADLTENLCALIFQYHHLAEALCE